MKLMLDTSVMVALIVAGHPEHAQTLARFKRLQTKKDTLVLCMHSLVELYAVLTRMPASPKIGPDLAKRLIKDNIEQLGIKTISLDALDYMAVLDEMTSLGLAGGLVYDMLIVQAARKSKSEGILTLNQSDFRRLCEHLSIRVILP